jgi:lipopolysaccharide/colanic/teichoic acid biosynthesis glycosyltransferase
MAEILRHSRSLRYAFDVMCAFAAPFLAVVLREQASELPFTLEAAFAYAATSGLVTIAVALAAGTHRQMWRYSAASDGARLALVAGVSVLISSFVFFLLARNDGIGRSVPFLHMLLLLGPMLFMRASVRALRESRLLAGAQDETVVVLSAAAPENVLVIGVNPLAELVIRCTRDLAHETTDVVGILDNDPRKLGSELRGCMVLGPVSGLDHVLSDCEVAGAPVSRIVNCTRLGELSASDLAVLAEVGSRQGISIQDAVDLVGLVPRQSVGRPLAAATSLPPGWGTHAHAAQAVGLSSYFGYKRAVDLAIAIPLGLVALPFAAVGAALVAISIGFPTIFWQKRPGLRGHVFRVYKLRTMRPAYGPTGERLDDEARQTALTRFVRRTRLDELPQLYNVIIGEMSLVGPRPLLPRDLPATPWLRQQMRPGLTGWAQVRGGKLIGVADKTALDLWYARHASFSLDMKILLMSVWTMLVGDKVDSAAISAAHDDLARLEINALQGGAARDEANADAAAGAAVRH